MLVLKRIKNFDEKFYCEDCRNSSYSNPLAILKVRWINTCSDSSHNICAKCVQEYEEKLYCPFGCRTEEQKGVCTLWMMNNSNCRIDCIYNHPKNMRGNFFKLLRKSNEKKEICIKFLSSGVCDTENCELKHPLPLQECKYNKMGTCYYKNQCNYLHPDEVDPSVRCIQKKLSKECWCSVCRPFNPPDLKLPYRQ